MKDIKNVLFKNEFSVIQSKFVKTFFEKTKIPGVGFKFTNIVFVI